MSYVARAPGQKCQCCGKDNSSRMPGTKWCLDCAKTINRHRALERKEYIKTLVARDTAATVIYETDSDAYCVACFGLLEGTGQKFCSMCGQRLDWSVEK